MNDVINKQTTEIAVLTNEELEKELAFAESMTDESMPSAVSWLEILRAEKERRAR